MTLEALQSTYADWRTTFNKRMEQTLTPQGDIPEALLEAMRYAVMGGGKRLRPLLIQASCLAVGGHVTDALPAALAVEMIHSYSLIHDDLPSMDDDALRRGRPTTHVVYGEALAILAGDALHSFAFETLARASLPAKRIQALTATLARAAGPGGMAGGQVLDMLAEGEPASEESVSQIHRLKTGALLAASHRLGAEAGGAAPESADFFEKVGHKVGLAFQIQDDILDETATTEQMGKTVGKDQASAKATWPAVVGLEESARRAKTLTQEALEDLELYGDAAELLRGLVRLAVERTS